MSRPRSVTGVAVVVPAADEAADIAACLDAIAAAAASSPVPVRCVVALDSCRDATAEVVGRARGVTVVSGRWGRVGSARRAGVATALRLLPGASTWLAHTDADSEPPSDWLAVMVDLAERGADAVCGTVTPRFGDHLTARRWARSYHPSDGHGHVHGANLGLRASAYAAVGGFGHLSTGEDVALVDAVRRSGRRVVATGAIPVVTSARTTGRAPGGVAADLLALSQAGADG